LYKNFSEKKAAAPVQTGKTDGWNGDAMPKIIQITEEFEAKYLKK
jgi:hypothetical protein